jgi:outer membrane protein OmpA-like peptidoglycan-associated protein
MSKRELIFLLLGLWIIACITWFYFISKGDDRSGTKTDKVIVDASTTNTATSMASVLPPAPEQENEQNSDSLTTSADVTVTNEQIVAVDSPETISPNNKAPVTISNETKDTSITAAGTMMVEDSAVSTTALTSNRSVTTVATCYFNYNSAKDITYKRITKKVLKKLMLKLQEPGSKIIVTGHSDNIGSDVYNQQLGLERAEKIKQYLLKKGLPANMIEISSMGETDPVSSNKTHGGRAKNRRVEITIIS